MDALEHRLPTSASVMVPTPWLPQITAYARGHPGKDGSCAFRNKVYLWFQFL